MTYCIPKFDRTTGLGNKLFVWARCKIFAHINNAVMLTPQWVTIRRGPLFRGGVDLKCFHNQILCMGLFHPSENEIPRAKSIYLYYTLPKMKEPDNFDEPVISGSSDNLIYCFEGQKNRFLKLYKYREFLFNELIKITNQKWINLANSFKDIPIGINIRRGKDFKDPKSESDLYTKFGIRTPLEWYIKCIKIIREYVGYCVKAFIVSDGTQKDLAKLLSLDNIFFLRPGSAISDLLVLSKAKVLIGAGGSSFSAWASFFGQMPSIFHPGQFSLEFNLKNIKGFYMGEFNPEKPNEDFLREVKILLEKGDKNKKIYNKIYKGDNI